MYFSLVCLFARNLDYELLGIEYYIFVFVVGYFMRTKTQNNIPCHDYDSVT